MNTKELIAMLNRDIAEEHAAILRYLVHSYIEGEDTPVGANLLSRSREEMWHMHWLGMVIGQLGGEPNLVPAEYPFDPTSRATILESYIKYEEDLVPHYMAEADKVSDPHIKRVLRREGWESGVHAKKFKRLLNKLAPEQADGLPENEMEMSGALLDRLQAEVKDKYTEMLQHVRHAWVYQTESHMAWELMDQSMAKMKQLAHFSEDVAENGLEPDFKAGAVDLSLDMRKGLASSLEIVESALPRHKKLLEDSEVQEHAGFVINLDLTIKQEEYQQKELKEFLKKLK
ncbi:MAG: ferritin-like domain-containing protein [Desulfovibrionales bacterium]